MIPAAILKFASNCIRDLSHGCTTARQEERWIEINQKKNKPAERLYEVKTFCRCGREVSRRYLTQEQLDEYDRKLKRGKLS